MLNVQCSLCSQPQAALCILSSRDPFRAKSHRGPSRPSPISLPISHAMPTRRYYIQIREKNTIPAPKKQPSTPRILSPGPLLTPEIPRQNISSPHLYNAEQPLGRVGLSPPFCRHSNQMVGGCPEFPPVFGRYSDSQGSDTLCHNCHAGQN
jgi:hypothetical protein